jgi:hypothetical protein
MTRERILREHVYNNRRQSEGAERVAERRRREDESPRLTAEVPRLQSLALEIEEKSEGRRTAEPTHVRRVVVKHAPALFLLPCGDARCKDGGHDVTYAVMKALRTSETRFEGQDACRGSVGTGQCSRVLHFVGIATYG